MSNPAASTIRPPYSNVAIAGVSGDGVTDIAVYRKGTWYVYDSGKPQFRSFDFGNENDIPVNAAATKKSI